ncbi:hypothetical protein RHS04_08233 [Rhizoctonia solani]|uniref:Uncharacterized protein n=1 Tax=Rhizoctonia solani TaxID=456999 RepID=A0A8H7H1K3_9AGAM|nr:hypothetical protein RHS04_08233 [Rhizoctonia solani]
MERYFDVATHTRASRASSSSEASLPLDTIHGYIDHTNWTHQPGTTSQTEAAYDDHFHMGTGPNSAFQTLKTQTHDFSSVTSSYEHFDLCQQLPPPLLSDQSCHTDPYVHSTQDSEDVRRVIFGSLVLDKNSASNTLSFILESYAAWIQRTAYDPVRVARRSKDAIVKHYGSSIESRWTITLMANLVRRLAKSRSTDVIYTRACSTMVSVLQARLRHDIALVPSRDPCETKILNATNVLDSALGLVSILAICNNMVAGMEILREAAPVFRWLCPGSPGNQVHLQTLFLHPVDSLRDYAIMDLFSSVMAPRSTTFQYDVTIDPKLESSVLAFSDDVGIQWARGIPDQITLAFARIGALRRSLTWEPRELDELEAMLQSFVPLPTISSDSHTALARAVVQECWREVGYIYLYMGVCRANAEDRRVMQALSRFLSAINRVKPGRVPDSFLMMGLVMAGFIARNIVDRTTILERINGVEAFKYSGSSTSSCLERIWNIVDAEGRPVTWDDWRVSF